MDEQESLVIEATCNNRLFGLSDVLDKNVDDIIVNESEATPTKPPDR